MDSSHISDEHAEIYSMGKLSEPELGAVEAHLLICESWQDRIESMDQFVHAMRGSTKTLEDAPPSLLDRLRAFVTFHPGSAWAGAIATLAAVAVFTFLPPGAGGPQHLELSTVRGAEAVTPHARAKAPIDLQLDVTEVAVSPMYTIELVDANGNVIRNYTSEPKASKITVPITDRL